MYGWFTAPAQKRKLPVVITLREQEEDSWFNEHMTGSQQ
jgi:hypothetical protein